MTETPDADELEVTLTRALSDIRRHWSGLLDPPTTGRRSGGSGAGILAGPKPDADDPLGLRVADDHDDRETDIDRATRIVSLRREVVDVLNAVSRWVAEDRPVTKALPDGTSAVSMSLFLERHAQWIAGRDADDNGYETDRLDRLAKRVRNVVAPKRRDWHYLGDCPLALVDDDDVAWTFCTGRVRVRIGGDESEATCSDCGATGPVEWWEDVLGVRREEAVRAPEMARRLATSLHVTVTERTVRNWAREGRITALVPFGPQPKEPSYWFDPRLVLDEVARMDRECPMCGRVWSGRGDVCSRCWKAMRTARPSHATEHRPTPAPVSLRGWCPLPKVVRDPHDDDRPQRCHYSDLPLDQCACGREHERTTA